VDDPDDPGGATNHGVTIGTLQRLGLDVNGDGIVDRKDVRALTADQATDLFKHMTRDEFVCRFRWTSGAVAIWDNRCTMHRALNDYDGHRRVVRRVTAGGDKPRLM